VNDDPLDLDELHLRLCLEPNVSRDELERQVHRRFREVTEVTPNSISYHDSEEMRLLHGVGKALKEEKIVDRRKEAGGRKTKPTRRRRRKAKRRQPA
jgi:hypothetical protein